MPVEINIFSTNDHLLSKLYTIFRLKIEKKVVPEHRYNKINKKHTGDGHVRNEHNKHNITTNIVIL